MADGEKKKKHWWLTNKTVVERCVREAKILIASQDHAQIAAALGLLEAALSVAPRKELALELKARCLLCLRRFKEVAEMLEDYIPTVISDDAPSSSGSSDDASSTHLLKGRVQIISLAGGENKTTFKCFSVSGLRKKVMAGFCKNSDKEGQWRYSVLGQACCHLGLMDEAMAVLQTAKRLATAAFRRQSVSLSDDIFSPNKFPSTASHIIKTESDTITHLLSQIKTLLRRKTAAVAALDAGLHTESIRHLSKILDGRRGAPQGFLSECYVLRASAYRSAGRTAEAISDCNKALALETSSIDALTIRATLFETIRCLPDSLHDLEHLKLLYNSILRDRKLPGPVWKRQNVPYREIPGKLCWLASKMQQLKDRVAGGEMNNVDYYALFGLGRGCSKAELERAHLILSLKHKPDKCLNFMDRCEFSDVESVKERGRMSAVLLYRLIEKGYMCLKASISDEEKVQRMKVAAGGCGGSDNNTDSNDMKKGPVSTPAFQGVFCRDLTVVGGLLKQAGFNRIV